MEQDVWNPAMGDGADFQVFVGTNGAPTQVFAKYIDPKNEPCDRRWFDYDVPLHIDAEQNALIRFVTRPGPRGDITADHAGWSEPRIVY
jgi:hypothetical protein